MRDQRMLREAWQATIAALEATESGQTLLLGPHAENLADQLPGPIAASTANIASLGGGEIPDGATVTGTGLPGCSFDTTVALSAWDAPAGVEAVADEAVRVTKPDGNVWLGDIDARALTKAMPAARPYGLLYRRERSAADAVRFRYRAARGLGVEAVRAGLLGVTETRAELPAAVVDSVEEGVEAVRSGIWPGIASIDPGALDRLLDRVAVSFRRNERFPLVLTLPWTLVRGRRPQG